MKNKTRKQVIKEKRNKLIAKVDSDGGFLLEEIAEIFNRSIGAISEILKVEKKNKTKK